MFHHFLLTTSTGIPQMRHFLKQRGKTAQYHVSDMVAVGIVDRLEMVDVAQDYRQP